jgi:hypothetical protein
MGKRESKPKASARQKVLPRARRRDEFNSESLQIMRMGIETLLVSVLQTEAWWRLCGDNTSARRTQQLANTIRAMRQEFFADALESDIQIGAALAVAEGLREAALHCNEGQAALCTRLSGGADVIERLCRSRESRS